MTAPLVFVSYSHDSQEHKLWVLMLATRLRESGVDAILDQWDLGPGGDLPQFMEQSLVKAARVLMICTERYVDKANNGAGGVGYEKMIVTADLLSKIDSKRVIPILKQAGPTAMPTFLATKLYIDFSTPDQFEASFDQLLRELLNAPLFAKPPLGAAPTLKPVEMPRPSALPPLAQFVLALCAAYDASSEKGSLRTEMVRKNMLTTKVLFDHALDLAEAEQLIVTSSGKGIIYVTARGREMMIQASAGS